MTSAKWYIWTRKQMVKKISLLQNSLDPGNPQNVVNLRYVHCVNHVSYSNPRIRACRIVDLNFNLSPCRKLATFSALRDSQVLATGYNWNANWFTVLIGCRSWESCGQCLPVMLRIIFRAKSISSKRIPWNTASLLPLMKCNVE